MGQQVRNQNAAVAAKVPRGNMPARATNDGRRAQKLVEQFLKLKPPKFAGSGDPEAATSWIEELEKAFALLRCTDEDKVTLAIYRLRGNASSWWRATKDGVFPDGIASIWDSFVGAFNGKYFSDTAREQKMAKFLRLRQNQLSVDEYKARFVELSKCAPRMIGDPVDRARRFRDGLKSKIKSVLVPLNLKDYDDLYERAQMVERDFAERAAATGLLFIPSHVRDIRQGKRPMLGGRRHIPPNRRGVINKLVFRQDDECRLCHQRHATTQCPYQGGACFGCGQRGHQVRDCPQRQQSGQVPPQQRGQFGGNAPQKFQSRPAAQGRVFIVTREEAKDSPTVTGTVLLHNHVTYALFNPGATHSFVAAKFVGLAGLKLIPMDAVFKISTPLKGSVVTAVGRPNCKLVIDGHEGRIDLIVLEMFEFDPIARMDEPTRQKAIVECSRKAVQFNPSSGGTFEFVRGRGGASMLLVSSLEAMHLLESGCQGYLATIVII
ncbi:uncharacterized protein LOC125314128 [Rhodamnia argentea]|uniref:Uncharacterized protein LOC125314128 n=1 Tax=Rhodamnia argentea TaxID=178133 RepID=A0ABM3H4M8_9MYRT|nr:uncharacterized protein LOC125314128 [Rhodamnia argentea]